jgi:hypothetical protein
LTLEAPVVIVMQSLQWGRSLQAAELAASLSYSIIKDLRPLLREVSKVGAIPGFIPLNITQITLVFNPFRAASGPRHFCSPSPLASHRVTKTG